MDHKYKYCLAKEYVAIKRGWGIEFQEMGLRRDLFGCGKNMSSGHYHKVKVSFFDQRKQIFYYQ